jgi:hypothetical protein
LPKLEVPRARHESASAQAERHLYLALLGALEAGLVRTMEDTVTVLRQASAPLGPVGDEWLRIQERLLGGNEPLYRTRFLGQWIGDVVASCGPPLGVRTGLRWGCDARAAR